MPREGYYQDGSSYRGPYSYGYGPRGQGYGPSFYGRSDASYGGFSNRPEYGRSSYYSDGSQSSEESLEDFWFEDDGTTYRLNEDPDDEPLPHFFDWWNDATYYEEDKIYPGKEVNAYKFVLLLGDFCEEVYNVDVGDKLREVFGWWQNWEDRAKVFVELILDGKFGGRLPRYPDHRSNNLGERRLDRSPSPRGFDRCGGFDDRGGGGQGRQGGGGGQGRHGGAGGGHGRW